MTILEYKEEKILKKIFSPFLYFFLKFIYEQSSCSRLFRDCVCKELQVVLPLERHIFIWADRTVW